VRVGNGARDQFQLDIFGEVADAMSVAHKVGLDLRDEDWALQRALLGYLEEVWRKPDRGIWEMRGPDRHFTHSKVMAWVAFDRAVQTVERLRVPGPVEKWRSLRDEVHQEVCRKAFNPTLGSFVQSYGSDRLDASLLLLPLVGFLAPDDPRMIGTVAAIERDLVEDGFVMRYRTHPHVDGLPPGEGAFLACTFWLADNLVQQGRLQDAEAIFRRLLALRNDVGLLSEEFDAKAGRLVGNFPQAFSHVALINTAKNLTSAEGPAHHRPRSAAPVA
jgi:GH15 family glucan-1,4-alpha-glucosidase